MHLESSYPPEANSNQIPPVELPARAHNRISTLLDKAIVGITRLHENAENAFNNLDPILAYTLRVSSTFAKYSIVVPIYLVSRSFEVVLDRRAPLSTNGCLSFIGKGVLSSTNFAFQPVMSLVSPHWGLRVDHFFNQIAENEL
jgi:hypothetical protein